MPSVYLIRHGRPEVTGVMLGQSDPPLDAQPIPDVKLKVNIVYTSCLKRSKQSAASLFPQVTYVRNLPDLNEISYGDWDGKTWDEIMSMDSDRAEEKLKNWMSVTPSGGEGWDDFATRVRRAFEQIRFGPFPAAVVAHEGVNAILANLLDGGNVLEFRQKYWQVNKYECA